MSQDNVQNMQDSGQSHKMSMALTIGATIELIGLVLASRQGRAAARLHVRIVVLFCLVAAVPAVLLATVASLTLGRGFDNWFSTQTRNVVETSLSIARAYAEQQATQLRFDVKALRDELEKSPELLKQDQPAFRALLSERAATHNLTHVFLVIFAAQAKQAAGLVLGAHELLQSGERPIQADSARSVLATRWPLASNAAEHVTAAMLERTTERRRLEQLQSLAAQRKLPVQPCLLHLYLL